MFNSKFRKIGIITGLSLSLFMVGCGSSTSDAEESVSEAMDYTITGIEPGAGQTETNEEAIDTYDSLEGWQQEESSTGAMLTELNDAIDQEEPIIVSAWSPHYMFAEWDIKYLEDPEGVFGEDQEFTTIGRKGFEKDMPEAYTLFDRFEWDVEQVEDAMVDMQEQEVEEVASDWVEENQDIVDEWTEGVDKVNGTPIDVATISWDAENLISHIATIVLEEQGFDVTLTPVDPAVLFEAIASGETDVTLSPSMPTTHGDLYEKYEGEFEDLGPNVIGAKIGLAVPSYMDIDSLEDLEPKE